MAVKVLLHTCCAPCASACVPRLREKGCEVVMLFANSNIDSREEFNLRRDEARRLAAADGVGFAELEYDHDEWLAEAAEGHECDPEKGGRCERCFRYNLRKAAEYAKANGFDGFATSLTVSPHKVSKLIFSACDDPLFMREDFKKREGFRLSVERTRELGLYRQNYCGCEFSRWRIHHREETGSTNLDAREGVHGDVFTAGYQTAGRGRLDHKWTSPRGKDLLMSVVLDVAEADVAEVAALPLVIGLAAAKAVGGMLKWPNDVFINGRKVAGILCERHGDRVIAGVGVNVHQSEYASVGGSIPEVRDRVLAQIAKLYTLWRRRGFAAVYGEICRIDFLKGRTIGVFRTDDDGEPVRGVCGGITSDGSLDVGGEKVYAGEAHVEL